MNKVFERLGMTPDNVLQRSESAGTEPAENGGKAVSNSKRRVMVVKDAKGKVIKVARDCVFVYVCIYVYMYVCMYICPGNMITYMCVCMSMNIYIYVCVCIYIYMQ